MLKALSIAAGGAIAVAICGGLVTDLSPWYRSLRKPSWQPPDVAFAPIWILILTLAAFSGAVFWNSGASLAQRERMLVVFAVNALLNVLWSWLFFRLKRPDWALFEVALLWLSIALMMTAVAASTPALCLLIPYLSWVGFAAFLNLTIVRLNPRG